MRPQSTAATVTFRTVDICGGRGSERRGMHGSGDSTTRPRHQRVIHLPSQRELAGVRIDPSSVLTVSENGAWTCMCTRVAQGSC